MRPSEFLGKSDFKMTFTVGILRLWDCPKVSTDVMGINECRRIESVPTVPGLTNSLIPGDIS